MLVRTGRKGRMSCSRTGLQISWVNQDLKTKWKKKFLSNIKRPRIHSWGAANLKPSKTFSLGLKVVNMVCSFQNLIKTVTSLGLEIESKILSLVIILET